LLAAVALDWTARGLNLTVLELYSASEDLDWTTQDLDSPSEDLAAYLTSQLEAAPAVELADPPDCGPRATEWEVRSAELSLHRGLPSSLSTAPDELSTAPDLARRARRWRRKPTLWGTPSSDWGRREKWEGGGW
jgi:hypothetical protein